MISRPRKMGLALGPLIILCALACDASEATLFRQAVQKLIDAGMLKEAEAQLSHEMATNGESHETRYLDALLLFKRKQFAESLKRLDRSLAFEQKDPEVYKLIAMNGIALKRLDIAETALQAAIERAPADTLARFHLGVLYYTTSRFALAERAFFQLIEMSPTFMKAYDFLGLAQEELRSDDVVVASYRKAIQLVEHQGLKDEAPYLHLAKFLWQKNRYQETGPLAQKAAELNPDSAEAWYVLGRLLNRLGRTREAEAALLTATRKDPKYAEARYLLSQLYRRLGRLSEADRERRAFEQIRKSEPRPQ